MINIKQLHQILFIFFNDISYVVKMTDEIKFYVKYSKYITSYTYSVLVYFFLIY